MLGFKWILSVLLLPLITGLACGGGQSRKTEKKQSPVELRRDRVKSEYEAWANANDCDRSRKLFKEHQLTLPGIGANLDHYKVANELGVNAFCIPDGLHPAVRNLNPGELKWVLDNHTPRNVNVLSEEFGAAVAYSSSEHDYYGDSYVQKRLGRASVLIEYGADPDYVPIAWNDRGLTLLGIYASRPVGTIDDEELAYRAQIVHLLISAGGDPLKRIDNGEVTILAVMSGCNYKAIQIMAENAPTVSLKGSAGLSPRQLLLTKCGLYGHPSKNKVAETLKKFD